MSRSHLRVLGGVIFFVGCLIAIIGQELFRSVWWSLGFLFVGYLFAGNGMELWQKYYPRWKNGPPRHK